MNGGYDANTVRAFIDARIRGSERGIAALARLDEKARRYDAALRVLLDDPSVPAECRALAERIVQEIKNVHPFHPRPKRRGKSGRVPRKRSPRTAVPRD